MNYAIAATTENQNISYQLNYYTFLYDCPFTVESSETWLTPTFDTSNPSWINLAVYTTDASFEGTTKTATITVYSSTYSTAPVAPYSTTYDVDVTFTCTVTGFAFTDTIGTQYYNVRDSALTTESFTLTNTPDCQLVNLALSYTEVNALDTSSFLTFNEADRDFTIYKDTRLPGDNVYIMRVTATLTQTSLGVSLTDTMDFTVWLRDECSSTDLSFLTALQDMSAMVADSTIDQTISVTDSVSIAKGYQDCGTYTVALSYAQDTPSALSFDSSTNKVSLTATDQSQVGSWVVTVTASLS